MPVVMLYVNERFRVGPTSKPPVRLRLEPVPFLVEDELLGLGATFSKVKNWGAHVITDGLLITGQNPASSGPAAKVLIEAVATSGARTRGAMSLEA